MLNAQKETFGPKEVMAESLKPMVGAELCSSRKTVCMLDVCGGTSVEYGLGFSIGS